MRINVNVPAIGGRIKVTEKMKRNAEIELMTRYPDLSGSEQAQKMPEILAILAEQESQHKASVYPQYQSNCRETETSLFPAELGYMTGGEKENVQGIHQAESGTRNN